MYRIDSSIQFTAYINTNTYLGNIGGHEVQARFPFMMNITDTADHSSTPAVPMRRHPFSLRVRTTTTQLLPSVTSTKSEDKNGV